MTKRFTLALLLHVGMLTCAMAQQGLSINEVFEGRVVPLQKVIETEVRGTQLKQYRLSLFRSLKFDETDARRRTIEGYVKELIPDAEELEQEKYEGRLYYAVMTLKPVAEGKPKRFVCYQCAEKRKGLYAITLVYMEGDATLQDLRKTFKRK